MTALAIIQARMGSTRFPGKALALLDDQPVIGHVITRVRRVVPCVVAIPGTPDNDPLDDWLRCHDIPMFRWDGPEQDVLGRFAACATSHRADVYVRITADCPRLDPTWITHLLSRPAGADYWANIWPTRVVPHGWDVECFTAPMLAEAHREAVAPFDREHVTPWMQRAEARMMLAAIAQSVELNHPDDLARLR